MKLKVNCSTMKVFNHITTWINVILENGSKSFSYLDVEFSFVYI